MLQLGVSYYPEHYDAEEWKTDLDRMKETGLSVIRMLDFAWTAIEPREGVYTFDWLDSFLDLAHDKGMEVVLCTPTATPPAWLARQYPEIMVVLRSGERRTFGTRRDVCVNSTIYRYFSDKLARDLGQRYGEHPAVVGWQIDNELMGPEGAPPECHCPECTWRFRQWLKARYESVERLNRAWWTRFWNQEYSDWGEIDTPRTGCTQGHCLDYARFFSDSQLEYMRIQYDALRATVSDRQWVTHNSTGVFNRGINHIDYAKNLDVGAWDAYPGAAGRPFSPAYASLAHDLYRSVRHEPFLVLETAGGRKAHPGFLAEMRAHGARMILVWHWRRHRGNRESGPNALCDYDGQPDPQQIAAIRGLAAQLPLDGELENPIPARPAAFVLSYDCARAQLRERSGTAAYLDHVIKAYHPFWQVGAGMDVVEPGDDLSGYRLAVVPSVAIMTPEHGEVLRQFVARGGVLLCTAPLAYRDLGYVRYRKPGSLLDDVLGRKLIDAHTSADRVAIDGIECEVEAAPEPLDPGSAETLATFIGGAADGMPAVTVNQMGSGKAFYIACVSHSLTRTLAPRVLTAAGIPFVDHPHENVSILPHLAGQGTWYFNHGEQDVTVNGVEVPAGDFVLRPEALS